MHKPLVNREDIKKTSYNPYSFHPYSKEWKKGVTVGCPPDSLSQNKVLPPGQQIRSKIYSFQNANFLISPPNPMMLPLIGIVSERQFQ